MDEWAVGAGLADAARRSDFILAVNEIAGNALIHAGGRGDLALWRVGDTLHCSVSDTGPGPHLLHIPDRLPDPGSEENGRGLWMARHLTDCLHITTGAGGTTVTVTMLLSSPSNGALPDRLPQPSPN